MYAEGKRLKVVSSDLNKYRMSNSFYSLLAQRAELREDDAAHQNIINVCFSILSVYFSITSSLKTKLNKTNSSHFFSQLLKSVLSDVDALTRLLYEILHRELVRCNKLWVLTVCRSCISEELSRSLLTALV